MNWIQYETLMIYVRSFHELTISWNHESINFSFWILWWHPIRLKNMYYVFFRMLYFYLQIENYKFVKWWIGNSMSWTAHKTGKMTTHRFLHLNHHTRVELIVSWYFYWLFSENSSCIFSLLQIEKKNTVGCQKIKIFVLCTYL